MLDSVDVLFDKLMNEAGTSDRCCDLETNSMSQKRERIMKSRTHTYL